MADLDTRGLADGFAQGFGMMNQYQRGKRADARADRQMDMREQQFGLQMEQAELSKEDAQHARDMEDIKFTLGKIGSGMSVGDDEVELLRKHPKFWAALDPQTDASIEQAQNVIDPESPVDSNDSESLAALNQMFGAEINKGDGGEKRVIGMIPSPDGESVMLELEVIGEDGQPYAAPMTEGRGTNDDDMVMAVPVEKLVDQVQGMRTLRNAFRSQEAQAQASKLLGILRGEPEESWEQVNGPGGAIFQRNTRTGEMKSLLGRAPVRGGSGSYAPSSDVKTIEYFKGQGYSHQDAINMAMNLKGRGDDSYGRGKDQVDYLQDRVSELEKVRDSDEWIGMSEDRQQGVLNELQQVRSERDQVASRIYGGGQSSPQPQASQDASGPAQIESDEDYRNLPSGAEFVGPDGAIRRKP